MKLRLPNGAEPLVDWLNPQYGVNGPSQARSDTLWTWDPVELFVRREGLSGACNDIGKYRMTGSQSLTVEEISELLQLTASHTYVKPGTQVTFTASQTNGQSVSPSWLWTSDSTSGDSTKACNNGVNPCVTKVWKSGTMRATQYLAGRMRQAKRHITTYTNFELEADKSSAPLGDTVTFTPKVDGRAAVAARWRWVPHTGTPGDSSCTADSTCKKRVLGSGTMWAYLSAVSGTGDSASRSVTALKPPLATACHFPGSNSRGSLVRCLAWLERPLPFTIVNRHAFGPGFQVGDSTDVAMSAGDTMVWSGAAVAGQTTVVVDAEILLDGSSEVIQNHSGIVPGARQWPDPLLTDPPDVIYQVIDGYMTPYPLPKTDLGVFGLWSPAISINLTATVDSGPNVGLSYLTAPIPGATASISIHPGLVPPPAGLSPGQPGFMPWHKWWYDQNGIGSGTCTASDLPTLRTNVERHEGVTMASNSHYGKANVIIGLTSLRTI